MQPPNNNMESYVFFNLKNRSIIYKSKSAKNTIRNNIYLKKYLYSSLLIYLQLIY
uniref:Uncharacterized protein n=1 Tax=Heterorhabditis bacteriophora TaxID=37862 RepID=A0A1I7WQ50_HETBA